jgi:hypothetical protein
MIIKKHLIKIATADNDEDLFLFLSSLLQRVQKKHPNHLEVVEVDESSKTILFMSSLYVGADLSRILMEQEQQYFRHDQKEGFVKVERLPYKVDC